MRGFIVALSLATLASSCTQSPTLPSHLPEPPPWPPPGAVVHDAQLPDGGGTFLWAVAEFSPPKGSVLHPGDPWSVTIRCHAPNQYSYFIKGGFIEAPEMGMSENTFGGGGSTNDCSNARSFESHGTAGLKDRFDWIRANVWFEKGLVVLVNAPNRVADSVVQEQFGWTVSK